MLDTTHIKYVKDDFEVSLLHRISARKSESEDMAFIT